jgi:integrase
MPRAYSHSHLVNGHLVGFSVKHFAHIPTYLACFRSLDGKRLQRDTNQMKIGQAIEAARAIIEKEYAPPVAVVKQTTWEETVERLKKRLATSGNRTSTLAYYLKLIRLVRAMYKVSVGPGDINPGMAAAWRDVMMTRPSRRKKPASAHYVRSLLTGLSALWQKWFMDDLKILSGNPWQDVELPKADKVPVKFATDEQVQHLFNWVEDRLGAWAFPKLFLTTKAHTACRLLDVCSLKSSQLQEGRLVFPADVTKGRKERKVKLPDELFAALETFKGETYLWEHYPAGLKAAIRAKGWPTHQLKGEFSPQRLYSWVETLFADYRKAHPDRPVLTTHMFRKRAFTKARAAGIPESDLSVAFGCHLDTARKHYIAIDEQEVTDGVFDKLIGTKR